MVSIQPLLVSAEVAATICGLSKRFWLQLDDQGRIPRSVTLGKRRLWKVEDLSNWVTMGCPTRKGYVDEKR